MTQLDDQILIPVRGWILQATGLDGSRVRPADDEGTRPDLPYITIRILVQGVEVFRPEKILGDGSENIRVEYTGTAQIDAYGRGGDQLITLAKMALATTKIRSYLASQHIAIRPEAGVNDLSLLVDDTIEKRFQQDFTIGYTLRFVDEVEGAPPMEQLDTFLNDHEFTIPEGST